MVRKSGNAPPGEKLVFTSSDGIVSGLDAVSMVRDGTTYYPFECNYRIEGTQVFGRALRLSPNDDDDNNDGVPDCNNEIIDGSDDTNDMARIIFDLTIHEDAPSPGIFLHLSPDDEPEGSVRFFDASGQVVDTSTDLFGSITNGANTFLVEGVDGGFLALMSRISKYAIHGIASPPYAITTSGLYGDPRVPVSVIKIEMITPSGDPITSPVQSGDGQNEFTYSTASPGVLTMDMKAQVTPSGVATQIADQCHFTVDAIGSSTLAWGAANPGGKPTANGDYLEATVTFTGLPANNSDFGPKKATIYFDGNKQNEKDYEVFFPKNAANHPGGIATDPNWFYYWKDGQVCGINANCRYDSTADFGYTLPGVDNLIRLGPYASANNTGPETWSSGTTNYGSVVVTGQGKGIKCVAETIQHEQHHLDIYSSFNARIAAAHANGGPNNGDPDDDPDSDALPNVEEPSYDGINSDPNDPDTFNMGGGYSGYGDNEVRCRKIELNLTISIHPDLDWANPGCQTKNPFGP